MRDSVLAPMAMQRRTSKGAFDCIKAFSETDLTEDLEKIDVPHLDRAR